MALLRRPPTDSILLVSRISLVMGTVSLACHYLGVNYKVAFVAGRSSVKDTLSMALAKRVNHKKPMAMYSDVRDR